MKRIITILFILICVSGYGQNRFPDVDSLKTYILKYVRNSTLESFTNLRMQNVVYGTAQFLDSAFLYSGVDSIWIVDGGANADTLRYRKWGVTYTAGLITGGGGGGSTTWGSITGTLSSQTDLQNALNLKLNISDTASMLSPYLRSNIAAATYQPIGSYLTYHLINGGNNLGSGAQVFKDTSSNKLNFRSIVAGSGVSVTQNTNDITISASSSAIDTGTIANRPVSPIFGQRYYQTDELVGMYTYTPRGWQWLFPETIYDIKFHSMTGSTNPRLSTFTANGGGAGSSTTFVNGMNETGWFNTGSNANGVAGFRLNTGQSVSSFNMRNRYMVMQFRVAFNLLSDGTNRYVAYLGTKNLEQSDGNANSIFWRYSDSLNSGRWQLVIVDASGTTTINTTVAVDDSTSYNLVVQKEPAFIRAFINGTKVGEAVFTEPASTFPAQFNGAIRKTVGTTARLLIIDKIRLYEY